MTKLTMMMMMIIRIVPKSMKNKLNCYCHMVTNTINRSSKPSLTSISINIPANYYWIFIAR